jgi:type IV pilus assembly protein PilV
VRRVTASTKTRGFSLLEAMVALVVLSVGMLGIAALHGQSLTAGRTAQLRTQAVNLAGDMADRIRVNRLGGAAYEGAAENEACDPQSGGGVDCTPAQMAAHDLFVWATQLERLLPNGAGRVAHDATDPPTYTIDVSWTEPGEGTLTHGLVIRVPEF